MAKTIITLGREYCTGGRYIAKDVARALGIKLYDKELITMAASIYIIDQTGTMQFAEVRLPTPPPAPEANQSTLPSAP